jgi:spermidine/putrescine transport system substrate-binding protein
MDRREFLRRSGAATLAYSGAGMLLAACGGSSLSSTPGVVVASPGHPVKLQVFDDNHPIDSGLQPEAGPLKLFNWDEYVYKQVLRDFEAKYGVKVELSTFYNMTEGVQKLRTGQVDYDVFFPTIDFLPKLTAAKLLQPLNLDYIPNLEANVWPSLADPFYDRNSRYSVPYTVYTTGICWRTDLAPEDIGARENPYDVFWDPAYKGKVGIYDDYREAMTMVLLRNGEEDINTGDPDKLAMVGNQLKDMADKANVRTTIDGAYSGVPEGRFAVHQAWSGDIVAGPLYMPKDEYGDPNHVLRYWWPTGGSVGNDLITIPKSAKNPVLAHLFLNYLLDEKVAVKNFSWVGYQPPINSLDPDTLVEQELVVPNLKSAVVTADSFKGGKRELTLPPTVDKLWLDQWSAFKSGD